MASPEAKKGSLSGGQASRRRSNGLNNNNSTSGGGGSSSSNGNSPTTHQTAQQLSLRAPVIRHRDPDAPVTIRGWLYKQGSDGLMLWKKRWFVLSQFCLFYYHGPEEEKVLGSVLLPSYTIRPCLTSDKDRVFRKFAFKAEHRNTRSFYLAADTRESMIQWMNALSLAAILQDNASLSANQPEQLNRSQLDVSVSSSTVGAGTDSRRTSKATVPNTLDSSHDASFDSTALNCSTEQRTLANNNTTGGQRQPLYANAPPKPRRLNTSRDSPSCSSSPDRSPERSVNGSSVSVSGSPAVSADAMYQQRRNGWPQHQLQQQVKRPVSLEVSTLMQQQRLRNSPAQLPVERRTPDAYGRFKMEYEDVYSNSTTTSSSSASPKQPTTAFVVANRSEVARRVPPRPHSMDFLQSPAQPVHMQQQQQEQHSQLSKTDYWASEENYAEQVRNAQQRRIVRDPSEISRDVKESALWSYVQQSPSVSSAVGHQQRPVTKKLSNSQENLIEESDMGVEQAQQLFHRSASARLPRLVSAQSPRQHPDLVNSPSLADSPAGELDSKRVDQREESMKRLLEWKQRMLQSPLTRKGGGSNSGARSSETSTPTMASTSDRDGSSPRLGNSRITSPIQPITQGLNQSAADYGNFVAMRRTVARATQDLLHQEHIFQQQQQQLQQNIAFRASLKRPFAHQDRVKVLDEEADVRREFTYEYVFTAQQEVATAKQQEALQLQPAAESSAPPKPCWPNSLMREKSSAVADLRARSESPSANRALLASKSRPKPPPKPSLHDLQAAYAGQLRLSSNGVPLMMMMDLPARDEEDEETSQRLSYAESLPESLAGFAASIVSEDGKEGTMSPPFEATVSPLTSECDWPHNTTANDSTASPAPLPDLMSLASINSNHRMNDEKQQQKPAGQHETEPEENLYMNAMPSEGSYDPSGSVMEDHYLPMTSANKLSLLSRSPPPLPAANNSSLNSSHNRSCFEENAYVEMTDNGKIKISPTAIGKKSSSVFAGVFDPSYRSPESPRYCEISDCPTAASASSTADGKQQPEESSHYEWLHVASSSSHAEPVYMEVPQSESGENQQQPVQQSEGQRAEPETPTVGHARQSSLVDASFSSAVPVEHGREELDLIIVPPRHPRFSISDTFRPASYFLKSSSKLAPIPSEESTGADHFKDGHESSDSELVSPPPIPTSPPPSMPHHHSRSQSLDCSVVGSGSQGGRCSRNSLAVEAVNQQPLPPASDLSRRRPLTIVRSLEDLLIDNASHDDQPTVLCANRSSSSSSQHQQATSGVFRGSTQSLASSNKSTGWHQPLYENVAGNGGSPAVTGHVRRESNASVHSSRRASASPAAEQQPAPYRQRLGSALSLGSTASNSSAPYYYSDLTGNKAGGQQQPKSPTTGSVTENIVVVDDGSLRSTSSRGAQAQAAKQAYQHSMDRLRTAQANRRAAAADQPQTPTTSGHRMEEPRQLASTMRRNQQQRAQTPDLLAHQPEQTTAAAWNGNGTPARGGGDVMRRVRSFEGLLDEEQPLRPELSNSAQNHNGCNASEMAVPRYVRDPTAQQQLQPQQQRTPVEIPASPWDEDQVWRDKLRRASIRHTRSMDMLADLDDLNTSNATSRTAVIKSNVAPVPEEAGTTPEDCYERLVQYSATLERSKRGQTFLDVQSYNWDEMEQRFRKPGRSRGGEGPPRPPPAATSSTAATNTSTHSRMNSTSSNVSMNHVNANNSPSHHFLGDSLPPPTFEIDREKLRQWDLMSTAPVPASSADKEGGRRPAGQAPVAAQPTPAPQQKEQPPSDRAATAKTATTGHQGRKDDIVNGAGLALSPRSSSRASQPSTTTPVVHATSPIVQHALHAPLAKHHHPHQQQTHRHQQSAPLPDLTSAHCPPGGSSPVQAMTTTLNATTGPAAKAINGIKVAYHQSGLTGKTTSNLVASTIHQQYNMQQHYHQQPDIYHSDGDMAPKKGKLPPMIGTGSVGGGTMDPNRIQLSAGDLLGRTHEELVLLLIQLRRQSSALIKARDACLLEMESQVKLASLDISHRQECLVKTAELKHHVKELEKQLEKMKPLISLVDNMVKLGSSMSPQKQRRTAGGLGSVGGGGVIGKQPEPNTAVKRNLTPLLHQQRQQQQQQPPAPPRHLQHSYYDSPTYSNVHQQQRGNNVNNSPMVFHSTPQQQQRGGEAAYAPNSVAQGWEEAQISQLESKHHQLAQLEKFVREEGAAIQKLTRDQQVLRLAIRGVRQQANASLQNAEYAEVERCRQQQLFLERELSSIHSLLALSSKRLEDAAVEMSRIETEISALHQQLHRGRHQQSPYHNSLGRSGNNKGGREMAWLEAELSRVQQHVLQLQNKRQELSAQVTRLTSVNFILDLDESWNNVVNGSEPSKRKHAGSTWCETDLDSLSTVDRQSHATYVNMGGFAQEQQQQQHHQVPQHQQYYEDDLMPVDINEADERMKRYYGIVPKNQNSPLQQQQQSSSQVAVSDKDKAEIRTVRIVKRESEKRQRDKTSKRSPYDDPSSPCGGDDLDEDDVTPQPSSSGFSSSNGFHDDIQDDPVLSQFSHVLTLPRRGPNTGNKDKQRNGSSQRNSLAETPSGLAQHPDQWRNSLRPRRNLSSLSLGDRNSSVSLEFESSSVTEDELLGSLDSNARSPILTPNYTSEAAREIVEQMRRDEVLSARRAVPRHKRRHITISCSQPLVLEARSPSSTERAQGRARDDVDLQRALRYSHQHPFAPDVVRSTISQAIRINEKTIDKLFSAPDKIVIPERYVPEQEVEEIGEEEKKKRLKKTESIRRMLTDSASVDIPRPPSIAATSDSIELSEAKQLLAKERQQRDHFLNLNQILVEEIKEKSKMAAVQALADMKSRRENSSSDDDWSPPADPLPIYQQRYNYLT